MAINIYLNDPINIPINWSVVEKLRHSVFVGQMGQPLVHHMPIALFSYFYLFLLLRPLAHPFFEVLRIFLLLRFCLLSCLCVGVFYRIVVFVYI